MNMNLHVVKQIANSFTKDLFVKNFDPATVGQEIGIGEFTVFPNSLRTAIPYMDRLGNFVTGLTKEEEDTYGKLIGLDLSPRSEVWGNGRFRTVLSSPKMTNVVFNPKHPEDYVKIKFLIACGYVAPKKEDIKQNPKYKDTVFYFSNDEEEESRTVKLMELKEEVGYEIYKIRNQKEKLLLICSKAGIPVKEAFTEGTLFKLLASKKDDLTSYEQLENLLKVIKTKPEDLQADFYVAQSLGKLIKFDMDNHIYTFNGKVLGANREEILTEFKKAENIELLSHLITSYKKLKK